MPPKKLNAYSDIFILLAIGIPLTLYGYIGTFSHIFRSDHWILFNWFNKIDFNIKGIIEAGLFDSFKHGRCQPLAYIILFLQYKLFGVNIFLHHLTQYLIHIINGILLFYIIKKLGVKKIYAVLGTLLFITFYSHFDIIGWTFHLYILIQATFSLLAFIYILKYLEKNKKIYVYLSAICSFFVLFIYEAGVFVPVFSIIFFLLLSQRQNNNLYQKHLKILIFLTSISYIFLGGMFIYLKGGEGNLFVCFSLLKRLVIALRTVTFSVFETFFYNNLGLPLDTITNDVVCLSESPPTFPFFLLTIIFTLIVILSFYYKDKKGKYFILLFAGIAFSYIFIIAFGRTFTNHFAYTYEQPRYAYFPNLMFTLAVVLSLKKYFSMNKFQKILTITVFSGLCILNTNKIHSYNQIISQQLSSTKQYIDTIEKFISKTTKHSIPSFIKGGEGGFKIFINFPVGTKEFFWGSDIALDMYFYKKKILTKNIYEANYIYDSNKGIYSNPEFNPNKNITDWTFEFKTSSIEKLSEEKNLFGVKNGSWYISITKDRKIRFANKEIVRPGESAFGMTTLPLVARNDKMEYKIFETKESFLLDYGDAHLIVQKEKNKITVAEYYKNKIIRIDKIIVTDDFNFDFSGDFSKFLGDHYLGKDYFGILKDLFIVIGKAKYGFSKSS